MSSPTIECRFCDGDGSLFAPDGRESTCPECGSSGQRDWRPQAVADTTGMDRADWLELRRQGIGGSDAAAIVGLDKYRTPLHIWLDKNGQLPEQEDNGPLRWGRILEPIVREAVEDDAGVRIAPDPIMWRSPLDAWQLVNLDGRVAYVGGDGELGVYEGKTASAYIAHEWDDGAVPDGYKIQGLHALAVTGAPFVLFGCLIGGQRLVTRRMERDQEAIDHLTTIERDFWAQVQQGEPPMPDGSAMTADLLAHLYDVKTDAIAVLDGDEVRRLLDQREHWKAEAKACEQQATERENRLRMLIGENEVATDAAGDVLFTWRSVETSRIDAKALREAEPELAAKFTTASSYRRFNVPKGKR